VSYLLVPHLLVSFFPASLACERQRARRRINGYDFGEKKIVEKKMASSALSRHADRAIMRPDRALRQAAQATSQLHRRRFGRAGGIPMRL
jgi:hypothetical protein